MTDDKTKTKQGEIRRIGETPTTSWSYRPRLDVTENADEFTIFADLPGTTADLVEISFEDRTLTIRGQVPPRQRGEFEFLTHEYGVGDFDRAIDVSDSIDPERITADYEHGVLTIHLPKCEEAKPRRIPVRAG